MAIGFARDVANVIGRGGYAFVSDDDGTTYEDFGLVKALVLEWTPEETEAGTDGQTEQLAVNVTLSLVLKQVADDEIALLTALASTAGLWLKYSSEFTDATGAGAADGYLFKNVRLKNEGSIQFNNTESAITLRTTARVPMSELTALGTTQEMTFG